MSRVTLAATLSPSVSFDASVFHRALALWNAEHGTALPYDELTEIQQALVRHLAKRLAREEHPCR